MDGWAFTREEADAQLEQSCVKRPTWPLRVTWAREHAGVRVTAAAQTTARLAMALRATVSAPSVTPAPGWRRMYGAGVARR